MYVTTDRLIGSGFQKTRSWRTGRLFPGEATRQIVPNPPRRTGRLGEDIRNRNNYYKEIAANLQSSPYHGDFQLSSDGGHEFETIKGLHVPVRSEFSTSNLRRKIESAPALLVPKDIRSFISNDYSYNPYSAAFPWTVESPFMNNVQALDIGRLSASITNMIPDHGEMGWGETLVELARGNIPKAVPDLIKRAKRGRALDPKGLGKDLGSDYLNAQFGIVPIVRDTISLIEHLRTVNDSFYTNIKRSRRTFGERTSVTYTNRLASRVSDNGGPWSDFSYSGDLVETNYTISTDTIIKAKFAKARPSYRSNTFLDEALLNIRKLGVNEKLSWDLLPFSWLLDWYGHIGNSIENAAAFNPSSGRYLSQYMWATTRTTLTASGGGAWSQLIHLKRRQVSPFGLNMSVPTLNGYQWSILAALGFAYKTK